MITKEVEVAITEVRETFSGHQVEIVEDGQGGARVTVHELLIGSQYRPSTTWVGFTIGFQYPAADVYPHFLPGGVVRLDDRPLGEAMTVGHAWNGAPAIQVSRKSNHWRRDGDTAAIKLTKVLEWLLTR